MSRGNRRDDSFSTILAEEILRAELKKLYGDGIKFFQRRMVCIITQPISHSDGFRSLTEEEQQILKKSGQRGGLFEKHVRMDVIVGPFERMYPENPPEDRRCRLRLVDASCRVFSIPNHGRPFWRPHYLRLEVRDDSNQVVEQKWYFYEEGLVEGAEFARDSGNPCQDMSDNQIWGSIERLEIAR